jgi:heme-degrading monooxygenase HmoA
MFLRATTVDVAPEKVEDAIRYAEEEVLPAVRDRAGNRGLAVAADRDQGQCSVVSFWDDLATLQASDERATWLRGDVTRQLRAALTALVAEVVELRIRTQPQPGCWNRITILDVAPAQIDAVVESFRTSALPAIEAIDGFCAALLCINRDGGEVVSVTTWRDQNALRDSADRADTLRQEASDKTSAKIAEVREQEIVLSAVSV